MKDFVCSTYFFLPEDFCTHCAITHNRFSFLPNYDYQPRNIMLTIFFLLTLIYLLNEIESDLKCIATHAYGICLRFFISIGLKHQTHGIGTDFHWKWHIATKRNSQHDAQERESKISKYWILNQMLKWMLF